MKKLTKQEIVTKLTTLNEWNVSGIFLVKTFVFKDFVEAFGFMCKIALLAEKSDHHPNWSNVYNKVEIKLSTHDADGITTKDFDLAKQIDALS